MSRSMLLTAAALMLVAAVSGCGGGEKPAKVEKPVEPAFAAQAKTIEAMTVASMSKMGPYAGAGEAMKALMGWVAEAKVQPAGGPFGVYMDDPATVKPESTRYEVCIAVPAGTEADKKAGVVVKPMGPMMVASAIHVGAYDKVGETYGKLMKWVGENKYEIAGPGLEFYQSPENTPAESLRTEVCFVVKEAAPAGGKKDLPPPVKK